jgi:hypothetical protein
MQDVCATSGQLHGTAAVAVTLKSSMPLAMYYHLSRNDVGVMSNKSGNIRIT